LDVQIEIQEAEVELKRAYRRLTTAERILREKIQAELSGNGDSEQLRLFR
jgi:uncharacterized OsmC-like protein